MVKLGYDLHIVQRQAGVAVQIDQSLWRCGGVATRGGGGRVYAWWMDEWMVSSGSSGLRARGLSAHV